MKTSTFVLAALSSASLLSAAPLQQQQQSYPPQSPQQTRNSTLHSNNSRHDSNFKQTPRTIMDDEIAKSIYTILAPTWISSGYPSVTFDVNNGTVNLRGYVETQEDKSKIEHSVQNTEGVKNVKNDISIGIPSQKNSLQKPITLNTVTQSKPSATAVSNAYTRDSGTTENDRLINTKIRDKIEQQAPRGYDTIVIATSNGAVTITGYVEGVEDIQKISSQVKSVNGVKSITNKISVKKQ